MDEYFNKSEHFIENKSIICVLFKKKKHLKIIRTFIESIKQ